ncbi:MAG TPA: M20/M25/M40 family metallo-hydrolase [Oligoflexia bacterium]|nr:M20/M25/M40 family metallo-hydrolase [Oligoflexia bacterium]
MMIRVWLVAAFVFSLFSNSLFSAEPLQPELRMLEMPAKNVAVVARVLGEKIQLIGEELVLVPADSVKAIGGILHKENGKCGGFIDVTDESMSHFEKSVAGLSKFKTDESEWEEEQEPLPPLYEIDQTIVQVVKSVIPKNIENFANAYSKTFTTRYAASEEGLEAPKWLAEVWTKMAHDANRSDILVELINPHKRYEQSSVRVTIPGTSSERAIVVIGAHLDSINQGASDFAPGVDDDASGIATMTETFRVLLAHNFRPSATVQFFGYAAEEVGLIGSRAIAESYRNYGAKVAGVMQLDMTGFPGRTNAVTFIRDHTSDELTTWTQAVFNMYVGLAFVNDRCGYACSDHASWHRYKYRSVFPHEAEFNESNNRIHTDHDLWDEHMNAEHAGLFARLAVAFTLELAK